MVSLNDVLGTPRTVMVRGKSIPVSGIPFELFPVLYRRFPEECSKLGGMTTLDPEILMAVLPALVAPVIAAGIGHAGSEDEEAAARRLNFMEQIRLLKAIFEETAPDGLDPLMEEVRAMIEQFGAGQTAAATVPAVTNGAASKASSKSSRKPLSN
jgi:hypothetical protein